MSDCMTPRSLWRSTGKNVVIKCRNCDGTGYDPTEKNR